MLFVSQLECELKNCSAAAYDEKSFWKLIESQRSSTQMSAFLVNGKLITDKYDIRDIWADHFEELGTPDLQTDYDNYFCGTRFSGCGKFLQNLPGPSSGCP